MHVLVELLCVAMIFGLGVLSFVYVESTYTLLNRVQDNVMELADKIRRMNEKN